MRILLLILFGAMILFGVGTIIVGVFMYITDLGTDSGFYIFFNDNPLGWVILLGCIAAGIIGFIVIFKITDGDFGGYGGSLGRGGTSHGDYSSRGSYFYDETDISDDTPADDTDVEPTATDCKNIFPESETHNFYDVNGNYGGYVRGDDYYDENGDHAGFDIGDRHYDESGDYCGYRVGDREYDADGNCLGYWIGDTFYDSDGNKKFYES